MPSLCRSCHQRSALVLHTAVSILISVEGVMVVEGNDNENCCTADAGLGTSSEMMPMNTLFKEKQENGKRLCLPSVLRYSSRSILTNRACGRGTSTCTILETENACQAHVTGFVLFWWILAADVYLLVVSQCWQNIKRAQLLISINPMRLYLYLNRISRWSFRERWFHIRRYLGHNEYIIWSNVLLREANNSTRFLI